MSWNLSDFERYRGMLGVYAFFDDASCIYVGKASCIYSRVKSHRTRFAGYTSFAVHDCTRYVESMNYENTQKFLNLMEAYYIMHWDPVENMHRPNFVSRLWNSGDTLIAVHKVIEITNCVPEIQMPEQIATR